MHDDAMKRVRCIRSSAFRRRSGDPSPPVAGAPRCAFALSSHVCRLRLADVNLIPFLTARENLLVLDGLGGRDRMGRRAERRRADQHVDELLLAHRAAIGRALMNEPGLVLFEDGRISDDWAGT